MELGGRAPKAGANTFSIWFRFLRRATRHEAVFSRRSRGVWCRQDGIAAPALAIVLVPLIIVVAFAIDFSRQYNADRHLQHALDAASLAGVLALEDAALSDEDIAGIVKDAFRANMLSAHGDLECTDETVEVDRPDVSVKVAADCGFGAMVSLHGMPETLGVSNVAKAQAKLKKMDLAFMLDVSRSMHGSRLDALKQATKDTAKTLLDISSEGRVRLAFVSFSTSVNAGVYGNMVLGRPETDDRDGDGPDKVCVSERSGVAAWNDDAPELGKWIGDAALECPDSSILALTDDLDEIEEMIESLKADGSTAGQIAIGWAWYLISPEWRDIWPEPSRPLEYTEPDGLKAVILMTDGRFNTEYDILLGESAEQARKMCASMRGSGVIVYAIAFQAPSGAQQVLKNCSANIQGRYFEPETDEELAAAYAAIASQLSVLALSE